MTKCCYFQLCIGRIIPVHTVGSIGGYLFTAPIFLADCQTRLASGIRNCLYRCIDINRISEDIRNALQSLDIRTVKSFPVIRRTCAA